MPLPTFPSPPGYDWLKRLAGPTETETRIAPWYLLHDRAFDLKDIWPYRGQHFFIAFARRGDNDDIACFKVEQGRVTKIVLVHGWTPEGFAVLAEYDTIYDWVKMVLDDIREWQQDETISPQSTSPNTDR